MGVIDSVLEDYAALCTQDVSPFLQELEKATHKEVLYSKMLSGKIVVRFLAVLIQISGAKKVLELGLYTGYSALAMAEVLPEGGGVDSIEFSVEHIEFAKPWIDKSEYGDKVTIHQGNALDVLRSWPSEKRFDLAFIDADKMAYGDYYEEVLKRVDAGGVIVLDNMLWWGKVLDKEKDAETTVIDQLNRKIAQDDRVDHVLLTVRDGLQLLRVK